MKMQTRESRPKKEAVTLVDGDGSSEAVVSVGQAKLRLLPANDGREALVSKWIKANVAQSPAAPD